MLELSQGLADHEEFHCIDRMREGEVLHNSLSE